MRFVGHKLMGAWVFCIGSRRWPLPSSTLMRWTWADQAAYHILQRFLPRCDEVAHSAFTLAVRFGHYV